MAGTHSSIHTVHHYSCVVYVCVSSTGRFMRWCRVTEGKTKLQRRQDAIPFSAAHVQHKQSSTSGGDDNKTSVVCVPESHARGAEVSRSLWTLRCPGALGMEGGGERTPMMRPTNHGRSGRLLERELELSAAAVTSSALCSL